MAVPTYLLIAADLRSKIAAGTMPPGTQLPPEKNLREEYGNLSGTVSMNTVRDAIDMLVREGLLERRRGQGTFIVGTLDSLPSYTRQPRGHRCDFRRRCDGFIDSRPPRWQPSWPRAHRR